MEFSSFRNNPEISARGNSAITGGCILVRALENQSISFFNSATVHEDRARERAKRLAVLDDRVEMIRNDMADANPITATTAPMISRKRKMITFALPFPRIDPVTPCLLQVECFTFSAQPHTAS